MDITSVRIKRRAVVIDYKNEGETHSVTSRDNPLPSFVKAVEALAPLVLDICHLPSDYTHGLKPTGLTLVEKQETQMVVVVAQKELTDCNSPFNISTPVRFLSVPKEEGSYSPPLKDTQVALVDAVISEAKKYVKGDRAQGQLPLEPEAAGDDDHDGEDGDGEGEKKGALLPFGQQTGSEAGEGAQPAAESSAPKKKRGAVRPPKKR
jgi:hypothetical protein